MSTDLSTKNSTDRGNKSGGWDMAILAAEHEILKLKACLAGLRSALRVFRKKKNEGEPWPEKKKGVVHTT